MGQIRLLPDAVIDQIAAGEVVERPASVVKELVENALDAGARQVTVTLQEGGRELISVLDDGCGMDDADARLAVQRHATSKLRDAAGLEAIATLGFRGEALASIAAVSRFELLTCADESAGGTRVVLEGGRGGPAGRQGFPRGTRVTICDLFFNTPARRKFLRTAATEFQHVQGLLAPMALAHPEVQFRLLHNGKPVYTLGRCGDVGERVHQLLGAELSEGLLPVAGREGTVGWSGLLSDPSHSRSSRRWQFLFINGRPVKNAGLNHAVYQAYRTLLMKDRHPAYVLRLEVDPREVDVNVHPAKTEVRLRNPALLHTVLADRLYKALLDGGRQGAFGTARAFGAPGTALGPPRPALGPGRSALGQLDLPAAVAESALPALPGRPGGARLPDWATAPWATDAGTAPAGALSPAAPERHGPAAAAPGLSAPSAGLRANPLAGDGFHFQPLSGAAPVGERMPRAGEATRAASRLGAGMTLLGQFQRTYLLAQREDGLVVVDQHAAHERILFEQYRSQFYQGRLLTERFLIPVTFELSPQNGLLLEQYLPHWQKLGFEIEAFGRASYVVRQIPALLKGKDLPALILEVLDELALFGKSGRLEEAINDILERVACHAAVRAGDALGREEMEALLAQLEDRDINLYCPHGRPVWVEIEQRELEKRFKRIV
jgi:DNA mismatch repair protein MutL